MRRDFGDIPTRPERKAAVWRRARMRLTRPWRRVLASRLKIILYPNMWVDAILDGADRMVDRLDRMVDRR